MFSLARKGTYVCAMDDEALLVDPDQVVDAPCRVVDVMQNGLVWHFFGNVHTADDAQPRSTCYCDGDIAYGVEIVGKRDLETKTGEGRAGKDAWRLRV